MPNLPPDGCICTRTTGITMPPLCPLHNLREFPKLFWRVGNKVPLNVYEGDRPVCQCHHKRDAARIVLAMNKETNAG